jgi:hypothetical protein
MSHLHNGKDTLISIREVGEAMTIGICVKRFTHIFQLGRGFTFVYVLS